MTGDTNATMTGAELHALRRRLGLSVVQMGRALGYASDDATVQRLLRRYERGDRLIPPRIAERASHLARDGLPDGWLDDPKPDG